MKADDDIREDSEVYGLIVGFPFANTAFVGGFQAGMLWRELWSGKETIECDVYDHQDILEGITKLAKLRGYTVKATKSRLQHRRRLKLTNVEHKDPSHVREFRIGSVKKL